MSITLNGNRYEVPESVTNIDQLLDHLELSKRIVIVEVNKEIIQKDAYNTPIRDRDQIEMIHFVGGG